MTPKEELERQLRVAKHQVLTAQNDVISITAKLIDLENGNTQSSEPKSNKNCKCDACHCDKC